MKKFIIIALIAAVAVAGYFYFSKGSKKVSLFEIHPTRGEISVELKLDGNVNPRNLLEIKPQVAGRIEDVLVVEGQRVKKGEILAWMSSTDRAALLDAARAQGDAEVKKWQDVYKPTPIVAPLDGFIINRDKEPGQTVALGDDILVMADQLIIEANVDETDLRNIVLRQQVNIVLDAYPDKKFPGVIEHIAYQSTVINNVTVYQVKILPKSVPASFRAGMSATIQAVSQKKEDVLMLPSDAITYKNNASFVTIKTGKGNTTELRKISVGITNGKSIEIVSGLTEDDLVVVPQKDIPKSSSSSRGGNMMGGIFGGGGGARAR